MTRERHLAADDSRAPSTPPSIMEGMRHRARLQDQAGADLRHAAETGFCGAGTPPLAFAPDGDVSDFMARYLYKGARWGSAWVAHYNCSGIPPARPLQGPSSPPIMPIEFLQWDCAFGELATVSTLSRSQIPPLPLVPGALGLSTSTPDAVPTCLLSLPQERRRGIVWPFGMPVSQAGAIPFPWGSSAVGG